MTAREQLDRLSERVERHRAGVARGKPIRRVTDDLYADLAELIRIVRAELPAGPIVFGGPHTPIDTTEVYR